MALERVTSQFYYVYKVRRYAAAAVVHLFNGVVDHVDDLLPGVQLLAANVGTTVHEGDRLQPDGGQKQNYANWYSYYRTRLLMMKTMAGQSFQTVDQSSASVLHHPRQGRRQSANTSCRSTTSHARSQKEKFFTKLYGISANASTVPQQYTPLRGALSKAGRIFAGKFFTGGTTDADKLRDPMQYSCQQNFALLASDGYWNSPTT